MYSVIKYCLALLIVEIQAEDFFVPSTYAPIRGHQYKLFKKPHLSRTRANFFSERIVNALNFLPDTVDFSSISRFIGSIHKVDFSRFLKCFKLLLWYVPYVLYNCYILCICVIVCYRILFFKGHSKSLSEPGVSCSTYMSLVRIAASLIFNK